MSKGNTFENDLLALIFNGTTITGIADDAAVSPLTSFYLALHTADVGDAGNQTTNEVAYTSYARAAVARTSGGWTITANSVSPTSAVLFPECTGGTATATHVSIGTDATGTGKVLYYGAISPTISISTGVTPVIGNSTTITED